MRFSTRFDSWLLFILVIAGFLSLVTFPVLLSLSGLPFPWGIMALPITVWTLVVVTTLPQYYELQRDDLYIRQGWKRYMLAYESIVDVKQFRSFQSAGVYSTRRISIHTQNGKSYVIAVNEEERFLRELKKRSPQLLPDPL